MDDRLIVTASPHIRDNATTRGLMGNVLIALVPSIVASGLIFGMRAILLTAVTTLACVVFEYLYCKLMHKPNPVGDLSACVTGVILALNMPVSMPLWIAIVGALVAIVIIKQLFGGLGYNFANPALVGRIVPPWMPSNISTKLTLCRSTAAFNGVADARASTDISG